MQLNVKKSTAPTGAGCPRCGAPAQRVRKVTVAHQMLPDIELPGDDEQYFLCRNPKCEVAYFQAEGRVYTQDRLKNKIWFKEITSPVPICYCLNVTEEEILHHVAEVQCCSTLEDIQKHTGANTGHECLTKNPAGG
ncbi:BFD-like [2Fe-2S] binding domain protein [Peptococcaceae bacterium CEB3]|nr:BFD-like [2Fe-2S] binding domain protein [Peptococcaceae bacterium CEB3]